MKEKIKITVFDDEERIRTSFKGTLDKCLPKDQYETKILIDFIGEIELLSHRQKDFRKNGTWDTTKRCMIDETSILIIDYDLFDASPFMKAESLAYLVRCFSSCGIIVILNRFGHNPYDLTLKDHIGSFADLHIGQDQLDNPYLWGVKLPDNRSDVPKRFYPWYWPELPSFYESLQKRIDDVATSMENKTTIEAMLGFTQGTFNGLSRSMAQFIGDDASKATIDDFIRSESVLEYKDRPRGDLNPINVSRAVATRISKWLEYFLLPEQDILVDAPHLVSRFPGLLDGNPKKILSWNHTAQRKSYDEIGVKTDIIEPFRYKKTHWLSRPAWFWHDVMEYDKIDDVREPWKISYPKWVFCEDASAFSIDHKEFVANTYSAFSRRYIKQFDRVDYEPRTRILM